MLRRCEQGQSKIGCTSAEKHLLEQDAAPNIISWHKCLIRRSRLQSKKNASVRMTCLFWSLESFPAGNAVGTEQACLGQLTFCLWSPLAWTTVCMAASLFSNSLANIIIYWTHLGHKMPNAELPSTREKPGEGTQRAH